MSLYTMHKVVVVTFRFTMSYYTLWSKNYCVFL